MKYGYICNPPHHRVQISDGGMRKTGEEITTYVHEVGRRTNIAVGGDLEGKFDFIMYFQMVLQEEEN